MFGFLITQIMMITEINNFISSEVVVSGSISQWGPCNAPTIHTESYETYGPTVMYENMVSWWYCEFNDAHTSGRPGVLEFILLKKWTRKFKKNDSLQLVYIKISTSLTKFVFKSVIAKLDYHKLCARWAQKCWQICTKIK